MDSLSAIMDAEMPRPPGKEDWAYRDLPQIRSDFFAQLLDLIGEENICWITRASYRHADGVFERGQMFVSPAGIDRIKAHNAKARSPIGASPADAPTGAPADQNPPSTTSTEDNPLPRQENQ